MSEQFKNGNPHKEIDWGADVGKERIVSDKGNEKQYGKSGTAQTIKMSFISLQRLLDIASKLTDKDGEVSKYEVNTLKYLVKQCTPEQQEFLRNKYRNKLNFLFAD